MIDKTQKQTLYFEDEAQKSLIQLIERCKNQGQKVFVLVDTNTNVYCLPFLKKLFSECNYSFKTIEISSGEDLKTIETATFIWNKLFENQADKNSVFINLGGGVITDLGGFAASCYKRGIRFYNIPTTLLGMIDAAIGGKVGVDFQKYKNTIGLFNEAEEVYVFYRFLETLPKKEIRSGLGEMLKYAYIAEPKILNVVNELSNDFQKITPWIAHFARFKKSIVEKDLLDQNTRKILNFGHTAGHAFETLALKKSQNVRHGEVVALGIFVSLKLSEKYCGLKSEYAADYEKIYNKLFLPFRLEKSQIDDVVNFMRQDKKNEGDEIKFVLIAEIGKPEINISVSEDDIRAVMMMIVEHNL